MTELFRRRPPALVIAMLALFISLGSSASALVVITSKNIKNGTIRGKDIRRGTISSSRIKRNGLGGSVIRESRLGQVPDAAHANAADTATRANSAVTAPNGAITADKLGTVVIRSDTKPLNNGANGAALAGSNAGERLLSGGGSVGTFNSATTPPDITWLSSRPANAKDGTTPTNARKPGTGERPRRTRAIQLEWATPRSQLGPSACGPPSAPRDQAGVPVLRSDGAALREVAGSLGPIEEVSRANLGYVGPKHGSRRGLLPSCRPPRGSARRLRGERE